MVNPKNRGLNSNLSFRFALLGGYRFISNQTSTARPAGVTSVAAHGATPVGQNVVFVTSTRWPPTEDGAGGRRFSAFAEPPVQVLAKARQRAPPELGEGARRGPLVLVDAPELCRGRAPGIVPAVDDGRIGRHHRRRRGIDLPAPGHLDRRGRFQLFGEPLLDQTCPGAAGRPRRWSSRARAGQTGRANRRRRRRERRSRRRP